MNRALQFLRQETDMPYVAKRNNLHVSDIYSSLSSGSPLYTVWKDLNSSVYHAMVMRMIVPVEPNQWNSYTSYYCGFMDPNSSQGIAISFGALYVPSYDNSRLYNMHQVAYCY